jgi:hypothetical protein
MSPVDDIAGPARASPLYARYGTAIDTQSAREILAARMAQSSAAAAAAARPRRRNRPGRRRPGRRPDQPEARRAAARSAPSVTCWRRARARAIEKEVVRGVFGMLKKRF